LTSAAGAYAAPTTDEYVVYVPELDLRVNPKVEEGVLKVLKRGTQVRDVYGEVIDVIESRDEYDFWREVEVDGTVGWVADDGIISVNMYEAFREADERGRAGDGEGMLRGLDKAVTSYRPAIEKGWADEEGLRIEDLDTEEVWRQYVSPDGSKAVVVGEWAYVEWGGGYPYYGRIGTGVPVLCFENGRGLARHFRSMEEIIGKWSPDSRYFAYPKAIVVVAICSMPFALLDTLSWEETIIGDIVTKWSFFRYEFADGWVMWIADEMVLNRPPHLEKESYGFVLWAYNLSGGEKTRILEVDTSTIGTELVYEKYGYKRYEAIMVPVEACPSILKNSDIYKKYANEYSYVYDVTHWMK
jgi:hypothetical protein